MIRIAKKAKDRYVQMCIISQSRHYHRTYITLRAGNRNIFKGNIGGQGIQNYHQHLLFSYFKMGGGGGELRIQD